MGRGYLSLKRKVGQYINIENRIAIYVANVKGNEVSLGIHAPDFIISRTTEEPKINKAGLLESRGVILAPGSKMDGKSKASFRSIRNSALKGIDLV